MRPNMVAAVAADLIIRVIFRVTPRRVCIVAPAQRAPRPAAARIAASASSPTTL